MRYKVFTLLLLCVVAAFAQNSVVKRQTTTTSAAKTNTQTTSSPLDKILVGTHLLSTQWISWENFGKVKISKTGKKNVYKVTGMQDGKTCSDDYQGRSNGDYLKINGTITAKSKTELVFHGEIIIKAYCNNNGQPCIRKGEYHFLQTDGRHYWRMQEMENPCDPCCDYVDIYLK